jgi:hypothetical protein
MKKKRKKNFFQAKNIIILTTAQHSTAQHSTAQHSTSTAQHRQTFDKQTFFSIFLKNG